MQENVRKYLEKLKSNRYAERKIQVLLMMCGLLVTVGVMGALILPGRSQEGDPTCGKEEHTHTEDCATTYACGKEEHTHTVEECAPIYGCGYEEHVHSADTCDIEYTCTIVDEGHVHSVDTCDFVYTCDTAEHTHTQSCGITYTCGKEEHTHTDDCGTVYACGYEEHTHSDDCYTSADDDGPIISEGLVVKLKTEIPTTVSGNPLSATVVSTYSKANSTYQSAEVIINVGALPEGIEVVGFVDGKKQATLTGTDTKIELLLEQDEDGLYYVKFAQPEGSTLEFDLTFASSNGITASPSTVALEVGEISGLAEGTTVMPPEDPLELTWTAENSWDPVDKKVNDEDSNKIAVTEENTLSGELTYTIQANSLNGGNVGVVWTDYITVTDTLTLPDAFSWPAGAKVNDENTAIVTSDGTVILSFTDLQGGKVSSLKLEDKTVTYVLEVPNSHRTNGVLTAEQDHLSLTMVLNAELITLPEDYIEAVSENDIIKNSVTIQPVPYNSDPLEATTDEVTTVPEVEPEKCLLTKTAQRENPDERTDTVAAAAGETIIYTLTLENVGITPIEVKKDDGTYYTVTDTLPEELYLSEEQIKNLPSGLVYDKDSNTLTWTPGVDKIAANSSETTTFSATVKPITDEAIKDLKMGYEIKNEATFKDATSDPAIVYYQKSSLNVSKTHETEEKDSSVRNGEKITYTIVVENKSGFDYQMEEVVTDTLPDGLTLKSVTIGDNDLDITGDTCILHEAGAISGYKACNKEHTIEYTAEGQELSWNIGTMVAGESLTITYVCTVDTDELASVSQIKNTAKITDGSSTDTVGVTYPIGLEKKVAQDTSLGYSNGSIFDYTITVTNDATYPSLADDHVLVDEMPKGMIPVADKDNNECVLIQTETATGTTTEIEWSDFVSNTGSTSGYTYSTIVDGLTAVVENINGAVRMHWELGTIKAGDEIELTYQAQVALTDEQDASGKSYKLVNTATIDDFSKSVTITAGVKQGNLEFIKMFPGYLNGYYFFDKLSDDDSRWDITFVLTGVDEWGNAVEFDNGELELEISLRDFEISTNSSMPPGYRYVLEKLPVGTYTLTELNYEQEGKDIRPEYMVRVLTATGKTEGSVVQTEGDTVQFTIKDQKTTEVQLLNNECRPDTVNLQKSVYEIARETTNADGSTTWTSLPEKYLFATDDQDNTKTLVVYNITVVASGTDSVQIPCITDKLPEGMTYIGIYNKAGYAKSRSSFTKTSKTAYLTSSNWLNDCTKVETLMSYKGAVPISSSYNTATNEVTFTFDFDTGTSSKPLAAGYAMSFLVLCEVDDSVVAGQQLTNTAELVVDGDVGLTGAGIYTTAHTPYDENQNNGKPVMETREDGKNVITSSVTIVPENTIVPGIEKNAAAYIAPGTKTEVALEEYVNIPSDSAVKWEVTVYNNGTQDMVNYTVKDAVTADFHMMTESEASSLGISTAYSYKICAYDGTVKEVFDISEDVWKTVTDTSYSEYEFVFEGEEYTVPSGGYAVLTMYTNNTSSDKKVYTNTATLIPKQEFVANKVTNGELKKDSDGKYIGVAASDQVYALGQYASVSWKTITEKADAENTAKGTSSKNFISVGLDSQYVTYTNNIQNISTNNFGRFVVIDLMPVKNDTGVVNRNDLRGSEFSVLYNGGMTLTVLDKNGEVKSNPEYTVEFSMKTGFTQKDFNGVASASWHSEWRQEDVSFRVILEDGFVLGPQETLVIQYDGKIESGATPGAIAWNSFGYQYYSSNDDTQMRAEPPKVGVMIPTVPIIQKEVVDSYGKVQERDPSIEFTFALWDADQETNEENAKICEFIVCQGGYLELSKLVDTDGNSITLENGKKYMITEESMPEGYELVGIGENGGTLSEDGYSFVYYDTKEINILARNSVDSYRRELPATGGVGTSGFKAAGVVLMLLAVLSYGHTLKNQRKKETMK